MKKIITVFISLLMVFAISFQSLALTNGVASNYFMLDDGSYITYYLDEYGNPYQIIDGQQVYIALALEHLKETDEEVIAELNSQKYTMENEMVTRTYSGVAYDLSDCANDANSKSYTLDNVSVVNFTYVGFFQYNRSHVALVIKTSGHKPFLCYSKNLNITYHYYKEGENNNTGHWYTFTMMNKDCNAVGGFRFQHSPSLYEFGRVQVCAHTDLEECDFEIYTTPYGMTGPSLPIV